MKIHGLSYQTLGHLETETGNRSRYDQLCIYDIEMQKLEREIFDFDPKYKVMHNYIQS